MTDATTFPGPAALGRGVVVGPGQAAPPGFERAPRFVVDDAVLAAPDDTVVALHSGWASRTPVVVELTVAAGALQQPEVSTAAPWSLPVSFSFGRERLAFLVWANTYDARNGAPVWWWATKAARLADGVAVGGAADVVLADGTAAWVDGGPRGLVDVDGVAIVHRESVELGALHLARFAAPRADLAPDQLDAVLHSSGPARVIAPAGSGKTRVLTERVRHLVADRGIEPQLVTAVAYNTKAAEQMRVRCGFDTRTGPQLRTFHALGFALLREFGGGPRLLDEREVRERVGALVDVRYATNTDPIAPYLEALALTRLALRAPEVVEAERDDVPGFALMFDSYREGLRDDHAIDFDEQIYGALELLLRDPAARRAAQLRCRHLLVDEFQDLTPAFVLLARLLAAPAYNVFGVGDDDQTIYGYAGADPSFLVEFEALFPGAGAHALEVNYRCPVGVVGAAGDLLRHNRVRVAKTVRPGPAAHAGGLSLRREPADGVAPAVVEQVRAWLDEGSPASEIAVLSRVNAWLLAPQVLLVRSGIPVEGGLDVSALQRTGLRSALAYLRLAFAQGRYSGADLAEVANRPSRRITSRARDTLRRRRAWSRADLGRFGAGREVGRDAERVAQLGDDLATLERLATTAGTTTQQLLVHVRDRIGLGSAMQTLDDSSTDVNGSHADDLAALVQVAAVQPDAVMFEPWLRETLSARGDRDGVRLASVHRVKGLEFDHVLALGVHRPHDLAVDVEEERRIAHVAITRARRDAHVLSVEGDDAPFLDEMAGREPAQPARAARVRVPAEPAPASDRESGRVVEGHVGLQLTIEGGDHGQIVEIDARTAKVEFGGGGWTRVKWGATVRVEGERATLEPPCFNAIVDALTVWRAERAARDHVPAYVIMKNSTRDEIARAQPTSLVKLGACAGIGPTKLERYGDDILVVVEQALDGCRASQRPDPPEPALNFPPAARNFHASS